MSTRSSLVALGTALALAGLAACTSHSGGASDSAAGATAGRASVAGSAPQQGQAQRAGSSAPGGQALAPGRADAQLTVLDIGTAKIRTVDMSVQVRRGVSVADQANAAEAIALGAGGEVDADERSSGRYAEATIVLRVPPEQLTATLTQLGRLGIEQSRHLTTQDVTSKVADVNSRVISAREAIARLRVLYQRAVKIADVINIESELSQRESDLESLESQQRALTAETATATITLTLTSPPRAVKHAVPPKKHHDRNGFLGGLQDGWHAFATGAGAVATAVGAILPFAVVLLIVGLAGRLLWPRLRPTRRPAPVPAPPQ
ncbi:MAG: DUF4349 domain-containing protein [Jatrophihabitantaceae bacterium]